MSGILGALAPIFLLIVLGYALKARRLVPDTFWMPAEALTFYVFFPALLVSDLAAADIGSIPVVPMIAVLWAALAVVVAVLVVLQRHVAADGPAFSSVMQGAVRPNTYVGIAAAVALFGDEGLTLIALCLIAVVPVVNMIAVVALVRWGSRRDGPRGWKATVGPVVRNPIILACAVGLAVNLSGFGLPPLFGPFLDILGRAALPVGLLAVGAGLDLAAVRAAGRPVGAAAVFKLALVPALTWTGCRLIGLDGAAATVCVLYAALPCSASAYIMARQLGGDAPVMAGIITATTVAAAATMPAVLILAR